MRILRNVVYLGAVSAAALTLSACESMKKAGDAITSIDMPFYGEDADDEETTTAAVARTMDASACPQVAIVQDLKNLTQFETPAQPSPGTKISSVTLSNLVADCTATDKTIAIDLTLTFDGELGPNTADWKTQSRSFAYPYFIAVTTPTGEILSKEVFAATMRYESGEAAIAQKEKIRQVIPLRPDAVPSTYEVLVGFQLTDDELNYARTVASNPLAYDDAKPVKEATPPKKKKAVKKEEPKVEPAPAPAAEAAPAVEAAPAPVAETVPVPAAEPVQTAPAPQPVAETVTPAQSMPAPTEPAAQDPAANPAATPATPEASATPPAPAFDPYAPPPTQVIRIKPDGTVEKSN